LGWKAQHQTFEREMKSRLIDAESWAFQPNLRNVMAPLTPITHPTPAATNPQYDRFPPDSPSAASGIQAIPLHSPLIAASRLGWKAQHQTFERETKSRLIDAESWAFQPNLRNVMAPLTPITHSKPAATNPQYDRFPPGSPSAASGIHAIPLHSPLIAASRAIARRGRLESPGRRCRAP